MSLVIDASVAVKTFVDEPLSPVARRILSRVEPFIVPAHFLGEVGEVLVRRLRANEVPVQQVQLIQAVWEMSFVSVPLEQLFREAFEIAMETGASLYDALYVAAAEHSDAPLVEARSRPLQ